MFASIRDLLAQRFGGITFHRSAPAEGLWLSDDGVEKDAIVTAEVMVDAIDREWWTSFRVDLERRFDQEEIVIRALPITRI
jgi:streptogramin lyase